MSGIKLLLNMISFCARMQLFYLYKDSLSINQILRLYYSNETNNNNNNKKGNMKELSNYIKLANRHMNICLKANRYIQSTV